ncbi:RNA polymerase sigma factor (sigma-70 family) [Cryobacterium mesophilum]|uniref:Sigma-70 family RNA polymerase sigma factor n=1 Tax=Terrimesophilobacter mesophilus TaxID=433647 RepID=A0A4R8VCV1_9MICO|nr:sigma-70 family RNA polymerase sigma factor [Terrimesophilobacter mesophilus]MBB5633597.1 RNA polymerase sigma factor (sigma-70 family) [Terrimesophilobacter mesophilus]TFB80296.1 sigma-70 family RNA polymerase sigma factor [Terrimesophilobacter mesophilus]
MDRWNGPEDEAPDQELVLRAREGDRTAFAELWVRHAGAGITVARGFTSSLDADDLVAEAFARIYQRVLDGGGPDGAFRPYLYTTIRNLASRWGRGRQDIQIEDIEDLQDDSVPDDPSTVALDTRLTARAFTSLPERWQSVLWYTEVEGMSPQDVAPILGLTANGVAALAYRAREGLRTAWLQAHVSLAGSTSDCKWVISRLGENARHTLTPREQLRMDAHTAECDSCESIAREVDEVGSGIAVILLPLLLGATVGGSLLSMVGNASSAAAAAVPTLPPALAAGGTLPGAAAGSAAAGTAAAGAAGVASSVSVPVLIGALAATVLLSGGVVVVLQPSQHAPTAEVVATSSNSDGASRADAARHASSDAPGSGDGATNGGDGSVGGLVSDIIAEVTDPLKSLLPPLPIAPIPEHTAPDGLVGALVDLDLNGRGMPGATVSAQVAGQVYTTVVAADGTWALRLTALPDGLGPITLTQRLTILGISVPLDIPLTLLSDTLGITVELLN